MHNSIILNNNGGKEWRKITNSYVKGFAFFSDQYLDETTLYYEIIKSIEEGNLDEKLYHLNGNFSCCIKHGNKTYLISDKLKTYPLLFYWKEDNLLITDDWREVMKRGENLELAENALMSYLATGYLSGEQTLIGDCKMVPAGAYYKIGTDSQLIIYHNHIYKKIKFKNEQSLLEGGKKSLENAVARMLKTIGDRPIWLPLSGGYDSRLLACVFKKLGVNNVYCFTYGSRESFEIDISHKVAKTLGFPWYYIEYTKYSIQEIAEEVNYIEWAMNLNSTSHYQDFVAIKELKKRGVLQGNAVIVPGHSGEILGRDQVPYHLLDGNKSVAELLYYRYSQRNILKKKYKKQVIQDFGEILNSTISRNNPSLAIDLFTNWNIQTRQSNFIINSVRAYEYFGIDWRIPLWDDEISRFWFSLDHQTNSKVKLYNKFIFETYFKPMGVAFYKKESNNSNLLARIRLPFGIKSFIKKQLTHFNYFKSKYDANNLTLRVKSLLLELENFDCQYIITKKPDTASLDTLFHINLIEKKLKKLTNDSK